MKKGIHYILTAILLMSVSIIQAQYLKIFKEPPHKEKLSVASSVVNSPVSQEPIDINKADADSLGSLKGVGPKKAKSILNYRTQHGPFKSLEEVAQVPGIGKKALKRILKNNPNRLVVNPVNP